jgi:serine phosphatase RsbU (regulator of sigma subunit)
MLAGSDTLPSGTYCTIALAMVDEPSSSDGDRSTARVVVATGGHPCPLLRRADGTVTEIDASGRLLGYFPTIGANEVSVSMSRGDTLVAFTDGVIERHDDTHWFGEAELSDLVSQNSLDADTLAALIRDTVVEAVSTPPKDDMAILVLRRDL